MQHQPLPLHFSVPLPRQPRAVSQLASSALHLVTQQSPSSLKLMARHQQNVNRSGSQMQISQTLWYPSPVFPSTSRCSQAPLELGAVLWDSARAFSGAHESTCSYGGAFRMLRDLTIRIVKFWRCKVISAGLWETSRAVETSAHVCRRHQEQLRPLSKLFGRLRAIFSQQWTLEFCKYKGFGLLYASLLQSQDSLHHTMACIV